MALTLIGQRFVEYSFDNNVDCDLPEVTGGYQADDLILIFYIPNGGPNHTINTPSGLTLIYKQEFVDTYHAEAVYYRWATGSEVPFSGGTPTSYNWQYGSLYPRHRFVVLVYRGADTGQAFEYDRNQVIGNAATPWPAFTGTLPSSYTVLRAYLGGGDSNTSEVTIPGDVTFIEGNLDTPTQDDPIGVYYDTDNSTGTTNNVTSTDTQRVGLVTMPIAEAASSPQLVGTPTTVGTADEGTGTFDIAYPAGVSASGNNEILVLVVRDTHNTVNTVTVPAGWTALVNRDGTGSPQYNAGLVAFKESNSESGNLTVTHPGARPAAAMFRVANVDVAALSSADQANLTSTAAGTIAMPTNLSSADDDATLWIAMPQNPWASPGDASNATPPAGVTQFLALYGYGSNIFAGFDDDASQGDPGDWTYDRIDVNTRAHWSVGVALKGTGPSAYDETGSVLNVGVTTTVTDEVNNPSLAYYTLLPNDVGTTGSWTGTWTDIDEGIDSPNTADVMVGPDGLGNSAFVGLTDMPFDFDTMETIDVKVHARQVGSSTLYVQAYASDESTPLSDEVQVPVTASWATHTVTLTGVVPGTKAQWDGVLLRLRQT